MSLDCFESKLRMGSHWDFKNISDVQSPEVSGSGLGRPPGIFPLARQPSIYSLTFDEIQNTMGGLGKDFGSMNMDEFLKNIWTAEETQAMTSSFNGTETGFPIGNLQRQGSLTLPRTLSQKTVDEVWRDLFKENSGGGKDGSSNGGSNLQQRQQTLGEMTLEEFLVRAGVVREETQIAGRPNNTGFGSEFYRGNGNSSLALGFLQPQQSPQPQQQQQQQQQQQEQQQQQQQQIFPKPPVQATVAYVPPLHLTNSSAQLGSPGVRGGGSVGIGDTGMNHGFVSGGGMGMVGLGAGAVTVVSESPANNGDTSSLSPVPYAFNGGLRGRRCSGAVEKVVERRQRRMIKNRESAARSRARKQAYTMELEAEVAKLKEENLKLQEKQAEIVEMQKNQVLEETNQPRVSKRQCLRRTWTGPW